MVDVNTEYERKDISSRDEVKIFKDFTKEIIRKKESDKIMNHLDTFRSCSSEAVRRWELCHQ